MNNYIFIIIATYNGVKWIEQCLQSIDYSKYNVIVVDNNSSDDTVDFIKDNFPKTIVLEQNKNLGFGKANNLGMSYALKNGADYVFLLNQDAYLYPDTITNLIEVYKTHPEYGIISPIHLNGDGTTLDRNFAYYVGHDKNKYFYLHAINNNLNPIYEVPFVNAAAWLLPKQTLLTVGGFDPIFFHYGEDDNYCQRLLYHGLKVGVVPSVFVKHDRSFSKGEVELFTSTYFSKISNDYKLKLANLNINNYEEIYKNELKKIKKKQLKAIVKVSYRNFKGYAKQLNILKESYKFSLRSRSKNKNKVALYLNT